MPSSILQVEGLRTYFSSDKGVVKAVDGVSFEIPSGSIMGLVGESGSGKSVTGLSILRLLPSKKGKIIAGRILFKGEDLLQKSEREMRSYRGDKISMVFQNALTALDPYFRIGDQLIEVIQLHQKLDKHRARVQAVEVLDLVGIPNPAQKLSSYPHELSGGQRQRVVIALALSCHPDLLIADEPTTALDATVQKQIVDLLLDINHQLGTSILMITHDFGVVAKMCQTVAVMYAGRIVEYGDVQIILSNPEHPYTRGLIQSVPRMKSRMGPVFYKGETHQVRRPRLFQIPGSAPDLVNPSTGCAFAARCSEVKEVCFSAYPPRVDFRRGHWATCHQRMISQEEERVRA